MKALLSPVSIYWFNSVLLTNIHTCMNGSQVQMTLARMSPICSCLINKYFQISRYFNCEPPTAEEYLRL